jgi:lipopolysaccharide/colanic/teichoic acid biosynthesis glycosyltransferase
MEKGAVVALHDDRSISGQNGGRFLADVVPSLGARRCAKRLFDIVVATTSLILLSPIILVVSVAVKIGSRGPLFSREILYGYGNQPIRVLKFRSVKTCVETNRLNLCATSVGRVLRQNGIDELPQLLNVLRGEMSIVGPRPYTSRQYVFGKQIMPLLNVKPGMIGWSRISESREGFRTTEQRINDDLHYVENWSLFLDIKIILMTTFSQRPYASSDRLRPETKK